MNPIGMVDGKIIDLNENIITLEDRGHQFGDGVYEVTKVYNGRCFALDLHLSRLMRSLKEIRIEAPYTVEELTKFHQQLIDESSLKNGDALIYLQITRGASPRAHVFPDAKKYPPRLTMSIRPTAPLAPSLRQSGVKTILIPDERWLRCDIKSLNLLANVLAKQKSDEAGCYEGILHRDGIITESTASNFAVVKDGIIHTHPANNFILRGITRTIALDRLSPALNIPVMEKPFDIAFLKNADEAFLTGTSPEVLAVVTVDGDQIGGGTPGPITLKLAAAYAETVDKECKR